jgi:hypothetical protein
MLTILWLLFTHLLFLIMGLGIASRSPMLRDSGWSPLVAPIVGHAAHILLSIAFCTTILTGRWSVLLSLAVLLSTTLASLSDVRTGIKRMWARKDLKLLGATCGFVGLVSCAAPIRVGIDTYNGYGSLDAWYYAVDTALLKDLRYFDTHPAALGYSTLQTASTKTRVGVEFSVMLVSTISPLDVLACSNLVLASCLLLIPLGVAFLAREALDLELAWSLVAVLLAGVHSSLQLAFCYQHIGQLLDMAEVPLALGLFYTAATRPEGPSLVAGLLGAAVLSTYWPMAPLYAGPAFLIAVYVLATGRSRFRAVATIGSVVLVILLGSSWRVFLGSALALADVRQAVARNDPDMVAFNPYLTEDFLPLFAGLVESGTSGLLWTTHHLSEFPEVKKVIYEYLGTSAALIALMLLGIGAEVRRRNPVVPAAFVCSVALILQVLHAEYGYGLYKLVSWSHVTATLALTLGLRFLWGLQRPWARLTGRVVGGALVGAFLWLNMGMDRYYAALSLSRLTGRFVTFAGFSGNRDWKDLEAWGRRHRDGMILIGIEDHVAEYWAEFRLWDASHLALVPKDAMGNVVRARPLDWADLKPLDVTVTPERVAGCRYFLTWARPDDVTSNVLDAAPVESNSTFKLFRLADVDRFLSLAVGWYRLENNDPVTESHTPIRWIKQQASVLLLRFPQKPVRFLMSGRAGVGYARLARTLRWSHGAEPLGVDTIEGTARVISDPFVPSPLLDQVDLRIDEPSVPMPRAFTLWNSWVAQDPRDLPLGIYDIRAEEEDAIERTYRPARTSYTPAQVRAELLYGGLHSDDWTGKRFRIGVPSGSCRELSIEAGYVRLGGDDLPARVHIKVNDQPEEDAVIRDYGTFIAKASIPAGNGSGFDWIEFEFEKSLLTDTSYTVGQNLREISSHLQVLRVVPR